MHIVFLLGNTFDVVQYNEDFEIWSNLTNKTNSNAFNITFSVALDNGQTVNIPMRVISIEVDDGVDFNRFGTSKDQFNNKIKIK